MVACASLEIRIILESLVYTTDMAKRIFWKFQKASSLNVLLIGMQGEDNFLTYIKLKYTKNDQQTNQA